MEYVQAILRDRVAVVCTTSASAQVMRALGAVASNPGSLALPYASEYELASILTELQRLKLPFVDVGHGWPPAAVFAQLRDEGRVHGTINTVSWKGPDRPIFGEA